MYPILIAIAAFYFMKYANMCASFFIQSLTEEWIMSSREEKNIPKDFLPYKHKKERKIKESVKDYVSMCSLSAMLCLGLEAKVPKCCEMLFLWHFLKGMKLLKNLTRKPLLRFMPQFHRLEVFKSL